MRFKMTIWRTFAAAGIAAAMTGHVSAMSLHAAVDTAMKSNPEIVQAVENREATEFELKQALGLYAPRVDVDASLGVQRFDSTSRRAAGIEDDPLYPAQLGLSVTYDILDGGNREAEVNRQSARVDGASYRVLETSEAVALEITRLYLEILLQSRIVELSGENLAFHKQTLGNVSEAIASGQLTEADRQQATERLASAYASLVEGQIELDAAKAGFERLVGAPFGSGQLPSRVGRYMPASLTAAIDAARSHNPRARTAMADLAAASALVEQAEGAFAPKLTFEGRGALGNDLSGSEGYSTDLQARLSLKWNIFDGGIKSAAHQESIRRESEAIYAQHQAIREIEEAVKTSWSRKTLQETLASQYREQLAAANDLVNSYQEQFRVGQRSLLEVLDAQNTRYNVQVLAQTASFSARFAEYRLMASTGTLLAFLNVSPPGQATPYARELFAASADAPVPEPRERRPAGLQPSGE